MSKGKKFWGDSAEIYLNDLMGDQLKVVNQLEDYREAISDFEDTNNQLMNLKINSVMKTFTSLSFLTFPFMLIAALFSMNTRDTPLIDTARRVLDHHRHHARRDDLAHRLLQAEGVVLSNDSIRLRR